MTWAIRPFGKNSFAVRPTLIKAIENLCRHRPRLRSTLLYIDRSADLAQHAVASVVPQVIRPQPRSLFVAITANCNFACRGCHYGREFMHGHQLPLDTVLHLLDDAKEAGFSRIRFYGGEPLAHRDLPKMVAHATRLGLKFWITTNGFLLRRRIDELYAAGARDFTLGYYGGSAATYDAYVQRPGAHARVEEGVAYTRQVYGDAIRLGLDWVLMRPTCSLDAVSHLWSFASRYRLPIGVNLVHYSLPYFLQSDEPGWQKEALSFGESDRKIIDEVVTELQRLSVVDRELMPRSDIGLRSIPDWLIKGPAMKVPCMSRRLIWVGADGTVQMCYVTFKLGNLHESRLRNMLFTSTHRKAAIDAYKLNCPNCNCGFENRVLAHGPSRSLYS